MSTKTNLKLAKLWLDRKEYGRLNKVRPSRSPRFELEGLTVRSQILKELHASCAPTDDGADVDSSKGTLQLEVYALEIQMYGETKNNKKLRVRCHLFLIVSRTDCSRPRRRSTRRVCAFARRFPILGSRA